MLKEIWQCKQLSGIFPMEVPSESDPTKLYVVMIDPYANRSELHICNCNGYRYQGRCKHQKFAHAQICKWCELDGPAPSEEDVEARRCPQCGGPMHRAIYEVEQENDGT